MKTIESSAVTVIPLESRRRKARRKLLKSRLHPYQERVTEITLKLTINLVISIASLSALLQLWPYHQAGQEKLQEIQTEVQGTQRRVSKLQAEFTRFFAPQKTKSIMQEQSYRMDPNILQIFWLERKYNQGQELETAEFNDENL
ncbi:MAG: hypothetical protein N3E45_00190 [Oscillatoriaceae bacterium SKW80]|nr:hypothetical protein [Oscillatoriaceae bacterium SKYG93]MCX8119247.1 hypothetical protein [Oscillatoriaceae bacterium SKW80]MDW8454714.1 hypothetical protein [Oscillatoriaceae cyanobacterium SKYGB_i_bin93]HIK28506.1 hypothetical protein [Oscillatoriaceae cyanobacterium M7585_C2015_266]